MTLDLRGLIPAIITPMDEHGDPDESQLRRYVRWVVEQGPVALAVNVDTGEGPHLTHEEKLEVLRTVRDETDLPCIVGVAGPFQRQAVIQAEDFAAAGADGLLVFPIPAYLSQPLDPAIPVAYHSAIAEVGLPLVLFQLQPALGGVNYEPDVLRRLCQIDGVVAIKEASFDARRFVDTVRVVRDAREGVTILTGNDNFILESFFLGAEGALIGFGAVMTREQVQMIDLWHDGKVDESRDLGAKVQHLADEVFSSPVANYRARLKECLVMLGVIEQAHVRPPLRPISDDERSRLREALRDVELLAT